jgi:N-acetylglucosaminyldiphosphoundecaprenol N-acetyl-beta-D-mannosaminyltransferase
MITTKTRTRIEALDFELDDLGPSEIHDLVDSTCESGGPPKIILAMNPEKLSLIERNQALAALYRSADAILPDGVGVRLAARLLAHKTVRRLTGADLMLYLVAYAARKGYSIAMIGSDEATNQTAADALRARFPSLQIAFRQHGYFGEEDVEGLLSSLAKVRPHITFIGLGSPRQELFVQRYRERMQTNVVQCVGGTFDCIAGKVTRAPVLFQEAGCEWLYRLMRQPSRVVRYGRLVKFSFRVAREFLKLQPAPGHRI